MISILFIGWTKSAFCRKNAEEDILKNGVSGILWNYTTPYFP